MAPAQLGPVVRHLRNVLGTQQVHDLPDAQLLQRFVGRGDEAAFTALVRRHARLVWGVCRNVLGHEQDAEDAFQATFLVLARKAGAIRRTEALGSWLYRVAYRVALRAGADMARRRAREKQVERTECSTPASEAAWRELQAILNEELEHLPEKYRAVFVLCCLEGKSGPAAARELGWKEGTLTGRLTQARKLLRQRLARRGVALPAVLCASVLARDRIGAAPAVLVKAAARTALRAADGPVSAHVAALAEGAARTLALGKLKIAAVCLLAAGLAAAALAIPAHRTAAAPPAASREPKPGPAPAAKPRPVAAPDPADAVVLKGRVLGPDGKPFAGATVSLWSRAAKNQDRRVRTTTGPDGRFRFTTAPAALKRGISVVAAAPGHGPDWVEWTANRKDADLTLRLVKDDVAINGRILDLEGRPVAGATIRMLFVERRAGGGDLTPWIETKRKWARGQYDAVGVPVEVLSTEALGGPAAVTTGKDGRFRLTGVGRERVAHLHIEGKDLAHGFVEVLTRPGPLDGLEKGNGGTYPAAFDYLAAPGKVVTGTVRDRRTGKPVAGITVQVFLSKGARAKTDKLGRYRITGASKQKQYTVRAGGSPYFTADRHDVPDTPDLEPVAVDFELDRGIVVGGRVTDRATGKPVRGRVVYVPLSDNPNLKNFPNLFPYPLTTDPDTTDADGRFSAVAVPGPGLLCAVADDPDRYPGARALGWQSKTSLVLDSYHAVVRIDPSEKDARSTTRDIVLEPGRTLTGSVVGPDGKPLPGAFVAGRSPIFHNGFFFRRPLKAADFTVGGLAPGRPRTLVIYHPEKKLGKVLRLRGDEAGPLTVRLEVVGGFTGRVLDARGRPWAGLEVIAEADRAGSSLPYEFFFNDSPWQRLTGRKVRTGPDGRFRIEGLVPGLRYTVMASEARNGMGPRFPLGTGAPSAEPGKTRNLGDLKSKLAPGREGEDKP